MTKNFYTPSEIAQILGVPHRRILEQLTAGEIEAELHRDHWTDRSRGGLAGREGAPSG